MRWLVGLMTLVVFALAGWFWLIPKPFGPISLEAKVINLGQVEVSVAPQAVSADKPVVFKLNFTTHSVELDYEITKAVGLRDDKGNTYQAVSWSGGSGGHHLQGELIFPPLSLEANQLTLSFDNIDNQESGLSWQL